MKIQNKFENELDETKKQKELNKDLLKIAAFKIQI